MTRSPEPQSLTGRAFGASPAPVTGATQVPSDPPAPGHLPFRPPMCPCENARMDRLACPCGLGDGYESGFGRLHAGAPAPTAESLMRSRYSAFAVGDAGYLLRTWHPSALSLPKTSSVQLMPRVGTHEAPPPSRSRRRMSRLAIWPGLTRGTGSGWSGRALAMP
jgi:hypothetical protein